MPVMLPLPLHSSARSIVPSLLQQGNLAKSVACATVCAGRQIRSDVLPTSFQNYAQATRSCKCVVMICRTEPQCSASDSHRLGEETTKVVNTTVATPDHSRLDALCFERGLIKHE